MNGLIPLLVGIAVLMMSSAAAQVRIPSLTGNIQRIPNFFSGALGNKRDLIIYLPPAYNQNQKQRYPVLYVHDGQNIFDGMTSFIPNQEWRLDETAEALINAKLIPPLIIVGIYNAGAERMDEFLPTRFRLHSQNMMIGGKADLYARMLVEEIKPMIDQRYRTLPNRENTGVMGSSLGGVLTLHLGLTHSETFSKVAIVSPSMWVDDAVMVKRIRELKAKLPLRIWADVGGGEGDEAIKGAEDLVTALVSKGWQRGKDVVFYEDGYAAHNEEAWARRVPAILMYLFGHLR